MIVRKHSFKGAQMSRSLLLRFKEANGWSIARTAQIGGVSKTTVKDWLTGRKPIPFDVEGAYLVAMRDEIENLSGEDLSRRLAEYEKIAG